MTLNKFFIALILFVSSAAMSASQDDFGDFSVLPKIITATLLLVTNKMNQKMYKDADRFRDNLDERQRVEFDKHFGRAGLITTYGFAGASIFCFSRASREKDYLLQKEYEKKAYALSGLTAASYYYNALSLYTAQNKVREMNNSALVVISDRD